MGPIFNIYYWFLGVVFLIAGALATAISGTIGFAITLLVARRRTDTPAVPGFIVGVCAGVVVGPLVFCSLCVWSLNGLNGPPGPQAKPARADVVGVWRASVSSLDAMRSDGHYPISTHTLIFNDDGSFEMVNMPDWVWNFGHSTGVLISGKGSWKITKDQGAWKIEVGFTDISNGPGFTTYFDIGGEKAPYYIYSYIGDADAGKIMVWEKP